MGASAFRAEMDGVQAALAPWLKERGFRRRGRTFNRATADGLTQVVNLQMGGSDPPGTTYIPGLRENLHGWFTVNLGVHVPEVSRLHGGGEPKGAVQEYHCCVRARLGQVAPEGRELWWAARAEPDVTGDVLRRLESHALPWLDRFGTRDAILREWATRTENEFAGSPPRIVCAILRAGRGDRDEARRLLAAQALEATHAGHAGHASSVRELATRLGLGPLDG